MKQAFLNLCLSLVGEPYIWGSENPAHGFDCSGFVCFVLQVFGVMKFERFTAQALCDWSKPFDEVPMNQARLGDLAFYTSNETHVDHVMICLGNNLCVGSDGGDETTTTVEASVLRHAGVHVRPINYRNNLYCVRPLSSILDAIEETEASNWRNAHDGAETSARLAGGAPQHQ